MEKTAIQRVEYYNVTVKDRPGEAYKLLAQVKSEGVNLLAFNVIPMGADQCRVVLFPEGGSGSFPKLIEGVGVDVDGPNHAVLVQGDDRLGAIADIHRKLADAKINVYASAGVTDGRGGYGYILYVKPDDFPSATAVLGI